MRRSSIHRYGAIGSSLVKVKPRISFASQLSISEYGSLILQGRDYDMMRRLDQHYYLNRAFCDNPLLPALNVTVRHALKLITHKDAIRITEDVLLGAMSMQR